MFLFLLRRVGRNARRCLTLPRRTAASRTPESPSDVQQRVVSLAHNLKKSNRVSKVDLLKILDSVEQKVLPSSEVGDLWSLLLRSCGHAMPDEVPAARMELARRCWSELQKVAGSPPPLELHNEFLRCHVENLPADFSVSGFLEGLEGAQPDERTFDLLLEAAAARGDLAQVVEVVSLMKGRGLPAKEHTFNNLLRCHARRRDKESFLQTLDTMRLAQVPPTADTFCCIAQGFCEAGDLRRVRETFGYARDADVVLREDHVLAIVRAAASAEDEGLLKEVFRLTRARELPLTDAVVNLLVQLVHGGREGAARLLFLEATSSLPPEPLEASRSSFGAFLLRELVAAEADAGAVLDLCSALEASGRNEWATSRAAEAALALRRGPLALALLEALARKGRPPLRPHFFWPLLAAAPGEAEVLGVLRRSLALGVRPDHETLADYVLPRVAFAADAAAATRRLQDLGLTLAEAAPAVLAALLREGRLREAVGLVSALKFRVTRGQVVRPLGAALRATGDAGAAATLLRLLLWDEDQDLAGQLLLEAAPAKGRAGGRLLRRLLEALRGERLRVGEAASARLRRRLRGLPEEAELLAALRDVTASGGGAGEEDAGAVPHPRDMSLEQLECHLVELRAKNMNARGVLRRLLQGYCRAKDFAGAAAVARALEESAAPLSAGMLASLLEVHLRGAAPDRALSCLRRLTADHPSFPLDAYKVVDLAACLALAGRLQDAEALLEERGGPPSDPPPPDLTRNCRALLDAAAASGGPEDARRLLELLERLGYCRPGDAALRGPLVRAHLLRGDAPGAVEELERCGGGAAALPPLHEVLLEVLDREELLGRALERAEAVHGAEAARVALAAALAEKGGRGDRLRALGVAWGPLLRRRCERFAEEGKLEPLLELAGAARGAEGGAAIYTLAMRVLYRRGDREGADALWRKLREEDVVPEERFVALARDLLGRSDC